MNRIAEIKALYEKATPGPWLIDRDNIEDREIIYVNHIRSSDGNPVAIARTFQIVGDAEIIVSLHAAWPLFERLYERANELMRQLPAGHPSVTADEIRAWANMQEAIAAFERGEG